MEIPEVPHFARAEHGIEISRVRPPSGIEGGAGDRAKRADVLHRSFSGAMPSVWVGRGAYSSRPRHAEYPPKPADVKPTGHILLTCTRSGAQLTTRRAGAFRPVALSSGTRFAKLKLP